MNFKKSFIAIDNEFFDTSDNNLFRSIGTEGFTLYCYLLDKQGNNSYCDTDIKRIQDFLNKDYDNRPEIYYGKKKNKISCMKDKKTIIKYLQVLIKNELITSRTEIDVKTNARTPLTIMCKKANPKNFTAIPSSLFIDYIHKTGHLGWGIFCLLARLHNDTFGGLGCEGFANPTQEYISKVIKRDIESIRAYSYLLQKLKLIKIEEQEKIYTGREDKNGNLIFDFTPNHYIVKYKQAENKYNLYNEL